MQICGASGKDDDGENQGTMLEVLNRNIVYLTRHGRISYDTVVKMELQEMNQMIAATLYWVKIENQPSRDAPAEKPEREFAEY